MTAAADTPRRGYAAISDLDRHLRGVLRPLLDPSA
jgi:hypothetical protein